jgi:putative ABC transport system permease protein
MLLKNVQLVLRPATPLAWLQLVRERTRLLVGISGIAFAVVLMFMQMGFRTALFASAVGMHAHLDGEIVITSPRSVALIAMERFSERSLTRALEVTGVQAVTPIYVESGLWKNPANPAATRNIRVYGINPDASVFTLRGVPEQIGRTKLPDVVLFDRGSRGEFGPVVQLFGAGGPVVTEVERRRVEVAGLFELGVTFGSDGALVTSEINFLRIFADRRQKGLIDIGLVKLTSDADPERVLADLKYHLGPDVQVMRKREYMDFEVNYWNSSTPIGFTFTLGAIMGFVVGAIIVYQVLYTDVADHLGEYATLKAMGYADRYFLGVVFQSAGILAALGFLPGVAIAWGLYEITRSATLLPMFLEPDRCLLVLALTFVMCCISGALAVRKLREADPADIF